MVVYLHVNTVNRKKYVGWTVKTIGQRWKAHRKAANKSSSPAYKTHFSNAIRKYGPKAFTHHVLCQPSTAEQAKRLEQAFIMLLEPAYNMTEGGEGAVGYKHTPETIAILRGLPHRLGNKSRTGQTNSPESNAKRAAIQRGRKATLEHRAHISAALKNKPKSPEHIAHAIAARRLKKSSPQE